MIKELISVCIFVMLFLVIGSGTGFIIASLSVFAILLFPTLPLLLVSYSFFKPRQLTV